MGASRSKENELGPDIDVDHSHEAAVALTCGYIRETSINVIIPSDIIDMIISYFYIAIAWNTEKYDNVHCILSKENTMTTLSDQVCDFAVCAINPVISSEVCKRVDIGFQIYGRHNPDCFIYGNITSTIKDWGAYIKDILNDTKSIAGVQNFYFNYDKMHQIMVISYRAEFNFRSNEQIILSFDFEEDHFQIYHNNQTGAKLSLNGNKEIGIAASLQNVNDSIEIFWWKFK